MRKVKTFRGKVNEDPKLMTTAQLERYCAWVHDYLDWCLDEDGRVNAYDRMSASSEPYFLELERRKEEVKKPVAKKKTAKKSVAKKVGGRRSPEALSMVNLKVTSKDRKAIVTLAKKHAGGNVSAWLRHAGLTHKPKSGEVLKLDAHGKAKVKI